jgi:hypothetical protein
MEAIAVVAGVVLMVAAAFVYLRYEPGWQADIRGARVELECPLQR